MYYKMTELRKRLAVISDIRQQAKTQHNLVEVLIISLIAIISSADTVKAIHAFSDILTCFLNGHNSFAPVLGATCSIALAKMSAIKNCQTN